MGCHGTKVRRAMEEGLRLTGVVRGFSSSRSLRLSVSKPLQPLPPCRTRFHRFKGVGSKTVSCVMMFCLGRPEFPVDTHVVRCRLPPLSPSSLPAGFPLRPSPHAPVFLLPSPSIGLHLPCTPLKKSAAH